MRYVVWVAGVLLAALGGGLDVVAQPIEPISAIPLQSVSVTANTGEKPQSKLWRHDGRWWAVLPEASGTKLWRLDDANWSPVLHLSDATAVHADALRAGEQAHVLLFETGRCELISLAYDGESQRYELWPERRSGTVLPLDSSVETATIDMDASGRLWLALDDKMDVVVRWSDAPYSAWSEPLVLATGMAEDDICALTAFPNGGVGVLWSNQHTQRYGFRFHTEGADPTDWLPDEVPSAASAQAVGDGMADDHLNFAVAQDGTLYAAVKTSYDTRGYPLIGLLVRRPSGAWDDLYNVDDDGTRPIVVLNEKSGTLFVAYTHGGNIVYRESQSESIAFGPRQLLIEKKDAPLNNVTSTKERFSGEIVFLASTPTTADGVQVTFP